jgi:hypothetical protein
MRTPGMLLSPHRSQRYFLLIVADVAARLACAIATGWRRCCLRATRQQS